MAIRKIFKSNIPYVRYITKAGKTLIFVEHKFITEVQSEIDELMENVVVEGIGKSHHPHIYVDLAESEIDTEAPSPMEVLEAQIRAKILAEMNTPKDFGNNGKGSGIGALNTTTNAALDPSVSSAKLEQLAAGQKLQAAAQSAQEESKGNAEGTTLVDTTITNTPVSNATLVATPAPVDMAAKLAALKAANPN